MFDTGAGSNFKRQSAAPAPRIYLSREVDFRTGELQPVSALLTGFQRLFSRIRRIQIADIIQPQFP